MNYFRLLNDVFFEKGSRNGALYDFTRTRVLPLKPLEVQILQQCESNIPVKEIKGVDSAQVTMFLEKLQKNQLGQYFEAPVRVERYLPSLTINIDGLLEPPFMINAVYFQLTSECNLRCEGCGQSEFLLWQGCNTCERWPGIDKNIYWSKGALDQVIDELLRYKIANVFFNGGNPLLQPQLLLYAIERLQQKSPPINIIITTNGSGATEEILDRVTLAKVKFYFVMLGHSPEEYEQVTGSEQGYADLVNGIIGCRQRDIPFSVSILVQPGATTDELIERKQWAEQLGAEHVFFAERIRQTQEGGIMSLNVLATTGPGRVKGVNAQLLFKRRESNSCLNNNIALAADSSVRPCPMLGGEYLGSLKTETLREIFIERKHEKYWQLTKEKVVDCGQCEFRYSCVDCAVIDSGVTSNPLLRRAVCSYDPVAGEWETV